MLKLLSRVIKISGKYKSRIQIAFIFAFLKSMLSKAPLCIAFLVFMEFYNQTMTVEKCWLYGLALLISVLLETLCQYISDRLQSASGYYIFSDMRIRLGNHLRKMPMGYFTEGNLGKISSVLSTDMVFIEENCMTVVANTMNYIFSQFIMIAFLFYLNPYIGMLSLLIILCLVYVGHLLDKKALYHSAIRQQQSEQLTNAVLDFTEGIGIIKTYNLMGRQSKQLTDNFDHTMKVALDFEYAVAPYTRLLNIAFGVGSSIMLLLAFILYKQSMLDVPYLIGMILFVFDLYAPTKALYSESSRFTVMSSCLDRIEDVFRESELNDNGKEEFPVSSEYEIEMKDVSFAYGKKEVLHHVNFHLKKGEMLALAGPSGSGKSTIASLLTRFWDVSQGEVCIHGRNVKDVQLASLMNQISMVFQRVYLFQDTIYNNIAMAKPDATKEEVIEAAKKARCYDFIMELENGFDTLIGEGGASLSGGEKQRISIARCILKDSPIIILDEATANVDADNESYIQEAIMELCKGKTLIVIAHRLHTIEKANQILVIDQGSIVQSGTHEELLKEKGLYQKLVNKSDSVYKLTNQPG